jgi:peptide/nickel transport system substrate-binding protein
VGALTLSACGNGGGSHNGGSVVNAAKPSIQKVALGTAADSKGPAPAVPGAKKGGTVTDLEPSDFNHLDPGQLYVSNQLAIAPLFSRTLTNYQIDPKTGNAKLVGDLATDTGEPSADKKTWTYHLKSGLKYEDGSTITSQDIKYGIERLYAPWETAGPTYVQQWLSGTDYRKTYPGPYSGKSLPDSLISTPDAKTIVFHFTAPHPDAPYAMSMPNISPVPKSKDTKQKYDTRPFSSGPYKIASYQPGKSLVMVRNKYWDAKTDPIREAYPNQWKFQIDVDQPLLTQRLQQDSGVYKTALALSATADPTLMDSLVSDSKYRSRTVNQYQPYVDVLSINTSRVKDVRVRKAIEYATPLRALQQATGGAAQGDYGTNLISPTIQGFKPYDPYNKLKNLNGDPAAAKKMLKEAGVSHLKLSFAYAAGIPKWNNVATTLKNAYAKAGIDLQLEPIDKTSYYSLIGEVNNKYDIYRTGWGADWSNGSTVIPETEDGRIIGKDSPNYSHLNDPYVNKEIDRINKISDLKTQQAQWEKLSEYIVKNDVPSVPYAYDKFFQIYGSGLGGVTYNQNIGTINANSVFVK